jgi:hypothetical protein
MGEGDEKCIFHTILVGVHEEKRPRGTTSRIWVGGGGSNIRMDGALGCGLYPVADCCATSWFHKRWELSSSAHGMSSSLWS